MTAPTYGQRWPLMEKLWDAASVKSSREHEVAYVVQKLAGNKKRYQNIEAKTGVPWYLIAMLHERESSARFDRQLAQGDPLNRRSTNEPISGPFNTFEDSAVWALHHDGLDKVKDWTLEKVLYYAELWNGWGYAMYHPTVPSPYIWGATTVQKPGKYVADGKFSSTAMDTQLGIAAMLKEFMETDKTVKPIRERDFGKAPVTADPDVDKLIKDYHKDNPPPVVDPKADTKKPQVAPADHPGADAPAYKKVAANPWNIFSLLWDMWRKK